MPSFLVDECEFLPGASNPDIEQSPRFSHRCGRCFVSVAWKVTFIHPEEHDRVELATLGAMQRTEADAACSFEPASKNG
jgi:hypothetical protein